MAEDLASDYLQRKGYQIKERNWRYSRAEIDIIAEADDVLIFVEVKSLSNARHHPQNAITRYKQTLLMDAANRFMESIDYDWAVRFDVITVILDEGELLDIHHYEEVFR